MSARYHVGAVDDGKVAGEITDALDQLAREGARLMLERALAAEVDEFLGRDDTCAEESSAATGTGMAEPGQSAWGPGRCR